MAAQVAVDAPVAGRENHLFVGAAANEGRASFTSQSALARLTQPDRGTVSSRHRRRRFARRRRQRQPRPGAVRDRHAVAAARSVPDRRRALQRVDAVAGGSAGRRARRRSQLPPPEPGAGHQLPAAAGRGRLRRLQRVDARADAAGADLRQRDRSVPAAERLHLRSRRWRRSSRAPSRSACADAGSARATTLDYVVAAFRTTNADDILFISSGTVANRGYFANVGDTRRQGDRGERDRAPALRGRRRQRAARMGDPLHLSRRALPDRRSRSCPRRIPTPSAERSTFRRARASRACPPTSARRRSPGSPAPASRPAST